MKVVSYLWLLVIWAICGCQAQVSSDYPYPRIISLAPSITEILFALDLGNNIVGITTCCDYPAQTKRLEKVATFSGQANLERILALKPDFVFSTGLEQAPLVDKLKRLGLNVVLVFPQNLNELYVSILEIGKLTQKEQKAQALVSKMQQKVREIGEKVNTVDEEQRPKIFIEICSDPLMTAGKGSFVDELITIAGGRNIAFDTPRPYSLFSPELVAQRNPDYIILGYMQPQASELIFQRMGWQGINAVKNRQIIADIHPDLFLRPGPRIIEGLEQIHRRLYLGLP